MPHVRLIGLVLFITTIFLAMAAAATQTTHIRFKQPSRDASGRIVPGWPAPQPQLSPSESSTAPTDLILPPASIDGPSSDSPQPVSDNALQFTAVPVVYPLLVAGSLGLLMWFVPAALTAFSPQRKRRAKRRRRR